MSAHVRLLRRVAPSMLLALGAIAAVPTHADCRKVNGHYTEQALAAGCTSPVGVCLQGSYSGVIQGSFATTVDNFVPNADMPPVPFALFTADSVLGVRIAGREGTLLVRNGGAVRLEASGEIVDLQTVVGGTGDLAGASGVMTAVGTFSFSDGGRSEYGGQICLPGAF